MKVIIREHSPHEFSIALRNNGLLTLPLDGVSYVGLPAQEADMRADELARVLGATIVREKLDESGALIEDDRPLEYGETTI